MLVVSCRSAATCAASDRIFGWLIWSMRFGPATLGTRAALDFLAKWHHMRLRAAAGNVNLFLGIHEDVDFAADTELGQIDSGLDGKARARQDTALLAGFEVIHVGAVAVDFLADGMSGSMAKIFAIAGLLDHLTSRLIDFPTLERLVTLERLAHPGNGC